jgi:hypothetical protein
LKVIGRLLRLWLLLHLGLPLAAFPYWLRGIRVTFEHKGFRTGNPLKFGHYLWRLMRGREA